MAKGTDTEVTLSLGSNCGDREKRVIAAGKWLEELLCEAHSSPAYETPGEWGGEKTYMNMVVRGKTSSDPDKLERETKEYERRMGRDREARSRGDVPIDIDIVVYGERVMRPRDYGSRYFRRGLELLEGTCRKEGAEEG